MAPRELKQPGAPVPGPAAPAGAASSGELELRVERLTYGPDSLARDVDGRVVFLDGGLPGETVRARPSEVRRDYVRAHVLEVIEPRAATSGGMRRSPPCPIVDRCGGCPWQHIEYPAQLAAKLEVALREIERAARLVPEVVLPAVGSAEWGSRHRIRLGIRRASDGRLAALGYRARATRQVVGLESCAIAEPALVAALPLARRIVEAEPTLVEVELLVDDRGALMLRGWSSARSPVSAARLLALATDPVIGHGSEGGELRGLRLEAAPAPRRVSEPWSSVAGDVIQKIMLDERSVLNVPLGVFTQVSLAGNRALVAQLIERVAPRPEMRVLDLYCGAGNFAVPLARAGATVVGVEASSEAARAARSNGERLVPAHRGSLAIVSGDVTAVLRDLDAARPWDVVLLDPPRAGAERAIAAIGRTGAPTIVYVSCDVASFARDARLLARAGYRFASFQVVDLTPQSYRAEGIGVFRLT